MNERQYDTVAQLDDLPFVDYVERTTHRDDVDAVVHLSAFVYDAEEHGCVLENVGATVEAVGGTGDYGRTVYVSLD
jgi:hypothetical protein